MGRPSAAEAQVVDQRILLAATESFLAKGYESTKMDTVALAARVSKRTLYARFPDKQSMLKAVVNDRFEAWSSAAAQQDWRLGTTLEQRLKHHMTVIMTWGSNDEIRAFDRLLATAPPEIARPLYARRAGPMIDLITKEIEHFTQSDAVPVRDARQVATDLLALVWGWYQMRSQVGPVTKNKAVEFGHHAVERMLAARASW